MPMWPFGQFRDLGNVPAGAASVLALVTHDKPNEHSRSEQSGPVQRGSQTRLFGLWM